MSIYKKACVYASTAVVAAAITLFVMPKPKSAISIAKPLVEISAKKVEAPRIEKKGMRAEVPVKNDVSSLYTNLLRNDLPELPNRKATKTPRKIVSFLPILPGRYSRVQEHYIKAVRETNLHDKTDESNRSVETILERNPTKSYSVFSRLPFGMMIDRLGLADRETIQILYPGAGIHITSLEVGIRLQKKLPGLKNVRYVFTETNQKGLPSWPEAHFEKLASLMGPDVEVNKKVENRLDENGTKRETRYELTAFGRKIEVAYAINLSEKTDHPFFRKKYVLESDIIIFHDTFGGVGGFSILNHPEYGKTLATLWAAESGRKKAIVFEDDVLGRRYRLSCTGVMYFVKGEYGCTYNWAVGAVVFFPDNEALLRMKESKKIACNRNSKFFSNLGFSIPVSKLWEKHL